MWKEITCSFLKICRATSFYSPSFILSDKNVLNISSIVQIWIILIHFLFTFKMVFGFRHFYVLVNIKSLYFGQITIGRNVSEISLLLLLAFDLRQIHNVHRMQTTCTLSWSFWPIHTSAYKNSFFKYLKVHSTIIIRLKNVPHVTRAYFEKFVKHMWTIVGPNIPSTIWNLKWRVFHFSFFSEF